MFNLIKSISQTSACSNVIMTHERVGRCLEYVYDAAFLFDGIFQYNPTLT